MEQRPPGHCGIRHARRVGQHHRRIWRRRERRGDHPNSARPYEHGRDDGRQGWPRSRQYREPDAAPEHEETPRLSDGHGGPSAPAVARNQEWVQARRRGGYDQDGWETGRLAHGQDRRVPRKHSERTQDGRRGRDRNAPRSRHWLPAPVVQGRTDVRDQRSERRQHAVGAVAGQTGNARRGREATPGPRRTNGAQGRPLAGRAAPHAHRASSAPGGNARSRRPHGTGVRAGPPVNARFHRAEGHPPLRRRHSLPEGHPSGHAGAPAAPRRQRRSGQPLLQRRRGQERAADRPPDAHSRVNRMVHGHERHRPQRRVERCLRRRDHVRRAAVRGPAGGGRRGGCRCPGQGIRR